MLDVRDLEAWYGDSHVLHGARISVGSAQRVALLGRNGAGKSTLLKSVMNAGPRAKGTIRFNGEVLEGRPTHQRTRMGLSLVPEDRRIFTHLTVAENIEMARYGSSQDRPPVPVAEIIARFPMLQPLQQRYGGQLSGGQQQLLAVARAMAANPSLLLLDEPTEGLAPIIVEELLRALKRLVREEGLSAIVIEQHARKILELTDEAIVLERGRVVLAAGSAELLADPSRLERHLGLAAA